MIRLIFVALFVVLFLIIGIPVLGIEWLIGKVSKKTMDYSSLRLVQWAFNMIIKLAGIELTVIGEENISEGPVLISEITEASLTSLSLTPDVRI